MIVAVSDGERLLVSRYRDRPFRGWALIAGFVEIGETLEDTVRREVLEETGLRVKNLRYYKSQPWSFSDTLLAGFYCDLDGSDAIRIEEDELSRGALAAARRDSAPRKRRQPDGRDDGALPPRTGRPAGIKSAASV